MKVSIPKSIAIGTSFEEDVLAFSREMKLWLERNKIISEEEKGNVPMAQRHEKYPRPSASALVQNAVNEFGEPNYQFFDDGPTFEQIFKEKKRKILFEILQAENEAHEKILPTGKRRYFDMRAQELMNLSMREAAEKKTKTSLSKEDTKFLKDYEAIKSNLATISMAAAKMQHDVEDLDESNIDSFVLTPFKI